MVALQSSNQCLFFETTSNNLQTRLDQSPSDHFHLVEKRLVSPFLPLAWRCDAYVNHYFHSVLYVMFMATPFLLLTVNLCRSHGDHMRVKASTLLKETRH